MKKTTARLDLQTLADDLHDISCNLWWTWNHEAQGLYRDLSPQLWEQSHHNPVAVVKEISRQELIARLGDRSFTQRVEKVKAALDGYRREKKTWAAATLPKGFGPVAYFSAEFGFHESLRTYSGGLGILAGDHTKSASDLGIPFIGITLFYRQGYFEQRIAVDGWQQEQYIAADPDKLPLELMKDKKGKPVQCAVEIGFSTVFFHAWKLNVGRSIVYLLDTNLKENEERFRDLTAHVYGGDSTTRISQEIILGIGGIRLLRALGHAPAVFHMNEGHSAFLTLELLREQLEKGKTRQEAELLVRDHCVFTTHTPVPAGHDRFSKDLMGYAFGALAKEIKLPVDSLMNYGRISVGDEAEPFCMTVLALKMSRAANGVSALHGKVSREMWKDLFAHKDVEKVPIGSITNGVHVAGWANEVTASFWERKLGADWQEHFLSPEFWIHAVDPKTTSDEELWALRYALRRMLIEFARKELSAQHARFGNGASAYHHVLNPDALTIGFSRRFATYKRAPLLFTDLDQTIALFNDPKKPIQLLFAGKAHPRDDEGKKYIKRIIELTKHPMLFGKVLLLENYDINVARFLVAGADIWLNNPRRPLEASGTSGQKIALHGGLNFSIMDGWWREAYDGMNGWSIGKDESPASPEVQDEQDSKHLYQVLKNQIIPEYYERGKDGIPHKWLKRVRHAIATLIPQYNTHRMVAEYVTTLYLKK